MTGRVAGAPISWGVCEVPGWGYQIAADRVLAEMAQAGLVATEFGPDGFLPANLGARKDMLHGYGLAAVGGFVPAVLHDPDRDPVAGIRAVLPSYLAAGASTLVLAAATGLHGYEHRPALDARGWRTLLSNMDRVAAVTAEAGISATLHPHVGTMVERPDEIDRVLDGAAIGLCLDTGHVLVGGGDPAELAGTAAGRIRHVHLKDVDAELAARVRDGASSYRDAVAAGLYRPLGRGDASIAAIVSTLDAAGYAGWYVLEQDTVLAGEPPAGNGPLATVQESLAWLASR